MVHSSGSWFLESDTDSKYDFVFDSNGKTICQLFNRCDEDFENKKANAQLIFTAPDLLSLLQEIKSLFDEGSDYSVCRRDGESMYIDEQYIIDSVFERVETAIASATAV